MTRPNLTRYDFRRIALESCLAQGVPYELPTSIVEQAARLVMHGASIQQAKRRAHEAILEERARHRSEGAPGGFVYRFLDGDNLLYIGMTRDPLMRLAGHTHKTFRKVATRVAIVAFRTEGEAREYERHAIYHERPFYNADGRAPRTEPPTPLMEWTWEVPPVRAEAP